MWVNEIPLLELSIEDREFITQLTIAFDALRDRSNDPIDQTFGLAVLEFDGKPEIAIVRIWLNPGTKEPLHMAPLFRSISKGTKISQDREEANTVLLGAFQNFRPFKKGK